jgi:hypothetical protein
MHTNRTSSPTTPRRRAFAGVAALTAAVVFITAGCAGNLVHSYESFRSALDRGASCSELFDQRELFDDPETLLKIDRDLDRIGCSSPDATRNDR